MTRIGRIKAWFRRIAGEIGVFAGFLFLILGIPVLIALPSVGVRLPAGPEIPAGVVRGVLILGNSAAAVFGAGFCALLFYAVVRTAWRWPSESVKDRDGRAVSPLSVLWWLWWAVLCGGFAWFCARRAISLWLGEAG